MSVNVRIGKVGDVHSVEGNLNVAHCHYFMVKKMKSEYSSVEVVSFPGWLQPKNCVDDFIEKRKDRPLALKRRLWIEPSPDPKKVKKVWGWDVTYLLSVHKDQTEANRASRNAALRFACLRRKEHARLVFEFCSKLNDQGIKATPTSHVLETLNL